MEVPLAIPETPLANPSLFTTSLIQRLGGCWLLRIRASGLAQACSPTIINLAAAIGDYVGEAFQLRAIRTVLDGGACVSSAIAM